MRELGSFLRRTKTLKELYVDAVKPNPLMDEEEYDSDDGDQKYAVAELFINTNVNFILDALCWNSSLRTLQVSDVHARSSTSALIAQMLRVNSTLQYLDLKELVVTDTSEDANLFAQVLVREENTTIERLAWPIWTYDRAHHAKFVESQFGQFLLGLLEQEDEASDDE
jgi:hypothetical protein